MEAMINTAYLLRGETIEDITEATNCLVDGMKKGFFKYETENDVATTVLSTSDMVLWPELEVAMASGTVLMTPQLYQRY
jgi:hypothetical protein